MSEETAPGAAGPGLPDDREGEAVDVALNFLSYRPRTCREVRRKLKERGYGRESIERALDRLAAVGLIDDEAFVEAYVRDRIAHRPMGARRMVQELYAKGVPREVSEPVIEAVLSDEGTDERELARRVIERKRRLRGRRPLEERGRKKLVEHLIRRGFDFGAARDAVEVEFPEGGAAPRDDG